MIQAIIKPEVEFTGKELRGAPVQTLVRKMKNLEGVFVDQNAWKLSNPEQVLYTVESYCPVAGGTEGGLFFGITHINSGDLSGEFFMTKGHIHEKPNRGEYYWGIRGDGLLVLKPMEGDPWVEKVFPGSLHYIPGYTAHRLINTGKEILDVGACWPADAGHEYGQILKDGFGIRVFQGSEGPRVRFE